VKKERKRERKRGSDDEFSYSFLLLFDPVLRIRVLFLSFEGVLIGRSGTEGRGYVSQRPSGESQEKKKHHSFTFSLFALFENWGSSRIFEERLGRACCSVSLPRSPSLSLCLSTMVLVEQMPSYPLPAPPPAIATAVLGVPTTSSSGGGGIGGGGAGGGGAATGIPVAPSTNRTAFLGAHLGVRASPLEAFVSTDPSDYAYGTAPFFLFFFFNSTAEMSSIEIGSEQAKQSKAEIL